jgi:hypothetical protein
MLILGPSLKVLRGKVPIDAIYEQMVQLRGKIFFIQKMKPYAI